MDLAGLEKVSATKWRIAPAGAMRVPAIIYADEALIRDMDEKVREQAVNVATLPGIVRAAYAMPDAHWGYGFPIGGVAAFDSEEGGVVSAGGVGFDISCGVRTHLTGLPRARIVEHQSMGTSSFVLAGAPESSAQAFASACHGAGRRMSRHEATRTWAGRQVIDELAARGIVVLSPSARGVAEEAPGAYKDASAVVDAAEQAGLARKVARLTPLICIKG